MIKRCLIITGIWYIVFGFFLFKEGTQALLYNLKTGSDFIWEAEFLLGILIIPCNIYIFLGKKKLIKQISLIIDIILSLLCIIIMFTPHASTPIRDYLLISFWVIGIIISFISFKKV